MLDWSSQDLLGVALGGAVYIFDVPRGDIQQLCDVEEEEPLYVTSLRWDPVGKHLAVATNNAEIKVTIVIIPWVIHGPVCGEIVIGVMASS